MDIYHGSEFIIEHPQYHGGKEYNDYGYGFYCTEEADMAAEWSVSADHHGYINHYVIHPEGLKILDLNQYTILTWLAVLLENRTFDVETMLAKEAKQYIIREFSVPYEKYDIIKGYRADDSYFSFAQDFINGGISYSQLSKAMKLGKLGEQIVLKSRKAFELVQWVDAKEARKEIWLPKRERRDRTARADYRKISMEEYRKNDLYITKILDEEIKKDDSRL